MNNVFVRICDMDTYKSKNIEDYNSKELVSYLTKAFPKDPLGMLEHLIETKSVGFVVSEETKLLLRGLGYSDKKN